VLIEEVGMQEKEIGVITHYFGKICVGIIKLKDTLKVGETIHVHGAHDDFTQVIDSMQIEHLVVNEAKAGDEVGIKVAGKVHENDKVFKVIE
jgi:putative protease